MNILQHTPYKKGVLIIMSIFLIFTPKNIVAILGKNIFLTVNKNITNPWYYE